MYCDAECQKAHWDAGHYVLCGKKSGGGKYGKVMREFYNGKLHSGSKKGPVVTDPRQAKAIAYAEQKRKHH